MNSPGTGFGRRVGHGRTAIATRSRLSSMSGFGPPAAMRSKSAVVTDATSASRSVGPGCVGQRARDLGVDDRAAVARVELDQPRAVKHAQHRLDRKARVGQQFGQLGGVQLAGVERVDRGVAAGGEGDPVGRRHQQHPARAQHPEALATNCALVPEVFDHLEVDHDIDVAVVERQLGQVAVAHLHPRVARADMGDRRLVVVEPDDAARDVGDQIGAVTLAAARFEHVATRAAVGQPLVDDLMAAEPVVLLRQARDGAFAGQGQIRTVGNECAHCKAG